MNTNGRYPAAFVLTAFLLISFPCLVKSQENNRQVTAYEDYAEEILASDEAYLSTLEEWQDIIDQWLEDPLGINTEEADWLMEYKIISLFQLNKLKEYRLIYGNLLSVYELSFIEGWDFQAVRKVIPLVTVDLPKKPRTFKKFSFRSVHQSLILKTAFNTEKSKGYEQVNTDSENPGEPVYSGSPFRLAMRYDLEYRNKLAMGLRMEKDPGEPFLISSSLISMKIKTPDLFSGYLHLKNLGPVKSMILGNYRVSFGYGINLAGGQSVIKGRNGMAGMANRIRPQTSVSETGFFRGVAFSAGPGRFSLTGFASFQKIDGISIVTDSLGNPVSFSSIDKSGMHRTISELSNRKTIGEKVIGGFLVYANNWLKTGIIAMYNQFDASVVKSSRPYAKFEFTGRSNLIAGISSTFWLHKVHIFNETSVCRNKAMAVVTGIEMMPAPGAQISIVHRYFAVDYQNLYGSGFISSSRNSGQNGLQVDIKVELPKKWLVGLMTDISRSVWASYDLNAPSDRKEVRVLVEKAWPQARSMAFSFRYLQNSATDPESSAWISHPLNLSQYKLRLEGRFEAKPGFRFKTRVECDLAPKKVQALNPGWLIFQDIEFSPSMIDAKIWLRVCFFDVPDYDNRIYAYENDVLYDFTSFMHYGKGIRGIMMFRWTPVDWLDLWLRLSTVYYKNRHIGSGWDEVDRNRQNEIEIQARIKLPG
ncbi:MAG: hypothetical protein M0Q51_07990 [Bacteroidales bacterium]|nr:hypothetical protein [Bacteroidales bacterium]